ncbi:MAG: class I SAM-dependent methyltransferase [Rhodospirillales bacterium]|nr:class I SAM-dependent methyltransferase [Rhodospirillales bacterium]
MAEPCQVCGTTDARLLVDQPSYRWVKCRSCGSAWISPMLSMDEAIEIQDETVGQSCIDGYLKKLDSKMRRSRRWVRTLKRHMPGPKLLDVGSSMGFLVAAAAELGLEATGIEINPVLVEEAQRRYRAGRFVVGAFEETELSGERFDGVYCSEVIEHVVDTNRFLETIAGAMNPKATLFLTTPALREYAKGSDPSRWRDFGVPDHKLYFSPGNIRQMRAKHGFEAIRIRFNFGRGLKLLARRA